MKFWFVIININYRLMVTPEVEKLILNYLSSNATAQELDDLSDWILVEGNDKLFEEYVQLHLEIITAMNGPDTDRIKKSLLKKIEKDRSKRIFWHSMKYAALILVLIGIGYFYQQVPPEKDGCGRLMPSDETISIMLENGRMETLELQGSKKLMDTEGNVIAVQDNSTLRYTGVSSSAKIAYNTLNVPYGKRFDIALADGTRIFLNSGTSLRFPVSFKDVDIRKVYLTGEAYFNVSKDMEHPFVVSADKMDIAVLGTQFNVSHYPEDTSVNTVLVEGSVALHLNNGVGSSLEPTVLEPGLKGEWCVECSEISVENVDTRLYTAWLQGKLVFRNKSFMQIREALQRKYNVSITNTNSRLDEQLYDATFDIETIEEVLESFKRSFDINYTIVDNKIIIQ